MSMFIVQSLPGCCILVQGQIDSMLELSGDDYEDDHNDNE